MPSWRSGGGSLTFWMPFHDTLEGDSPDGSLLPPLLSLLPPLPSLPSQWSCVLVGSVVVEVCEAGWGAEG